MPWALQIPRWRHDDPRRARHRLDDHGSDVFGAMLVDEVVQRLRSLDSKRRQARAEAVALLVQGVGQVIGVQQIAKGATIVRQAPHRNSTKADPVIGLVAADE